MFKSYTFQSNNCGKHILILGAVHGNEVAGVIAQNKIIQRIQSGEICLKSGSVTFIPIVNEKAYHQDTRFVDENLNRVIKFHEHPQKHEEFIANQLIKEIEKADILLDLHSTHAQNDKPFAFIDHPSNENLEFLKIIPVESALAGWPEIYKSNTQIENNCTVEYAFLNNISALTVECGYHKANEAIDIAMHSILNTLLYFDVIDGEKPVEFNKKIIHLDSFIIKEKDGILSKDFNHLDPILSGDILAQYSPFETLTAPFDGFIIMPNKEASIGSEWFYIGKENI